MNLPKVTVREMVRLLRQRAEKAEARVAELEAALMAERDWHAGWAGSGYQKGDLSPEGHVARAARIEAAQKPGLPDGVRVWKRGGHVRLTTGDGVMWGRDGSGCWYTFVASEEWTRRRCTKLHGPEALAIYEDWKARKA